MTKYKLEHPERLIKGVLIIAMALLVISLLGKVFKSGKDDEREEASAEESAQESSYSYQGVETFSIDPAQNQMQGTLRGVSAILPESMGNQLAAYMSAMLLSNLENVKTSMANYINGSDDPLLGYNPDNYRYIVGINPTRGGAEKGYTVENVMEKDITLDVARSMIAYLNEHNDGYFFFLTRDTDTTKTDAARMNLAKGYQCDMLITLACNGSEEELGGTIGTYYSQYDELWYEQYLKLQEGQDEDDIKVEMTDEQKVRDGLSKDLAELLMDACAEGFGMWSRFPETENTVLTNNEYVSVVIYMGFLTYEFDRDLARDPLKQQQAGEAMAKVLLEFLKDEAPVRPPVEKIVDVQTVDDYDPEKVYNLAPTENKEEDSGSDD